MLLRTNRLKQFVRISPSLSLRRYGTLVHKKDIETYERDGVVCLRNVLPSKYTNLLLEAVLQTTRAQNPGVHFFREVTSPKADGRFHMNSFSWRWQKDLRELALRSPLVAVAAQLLEANQLSFFYDQVFVKDPGTKDKTHFHHDLPYWPLSGSQIVSIWVALTPVSKEISGLEYIAGSHLWNRLFRAVAPDRDPRFDNQQLELCPDFFDPAIRKTVREKFVSFSLQPGDVVCHHPLTVHGASGNASATNRRVGISLRYCGDDVRWLNRGFTMRIPGQPERFLKDGDRPILNGLFPLVWDNGKPIYE